MGVRLPQLSSMKTLIVTFCLAVAAQVIPSAYHYPVHTLAKSTIKYKTAAFEPVDAATPADTQKVELVEKEHEQEILTPTITYHAAPAVYHHAAAVAPAVYHHAAAAPATAVSYSLGGYPFAVP